MKNKKLLLLAGLLVMTSFGAVTAASAATPNCTGDNSTIFDGQFGGDCIELPPPIPGGGDPGNGGIIGGGVPQTPPSGKHWWPVDPPLGPCGNQGQLYAMYSTWEPSPSAPIVDPASPDTVSCLEPDQGFGSAPGGGAPPLPTAEALRAQAGLAVTPGIIKSDFERRFLTGEPVTFTAEVPEVLTKELDFPGYDVWIEAKPVSFDWTFGDGATASGKNPDPHEYQALPADGSKSIKVGLTVVWSGTLHVASGGQELQMLQLGTIPAESFIERPILAVTSAPMELNPNV